MFARSLAVSIYPTPLLASPQHRSCCYRHVRASIRSTVGLIWCISLTATPVLWSWSAKFRCYSVSASESSAFVLGQSVDEGSCLAELVIISRSAPPGNSITAIAGRLLVRCSSLVSSITRASYRVMVTCSLERNRLAQ